MLGKRNWNVVFNADDRCQTNIEAFALDELYRHHKDVAYEIVCRARANEAGYLKEIIQVYSEMGLDADTIHRFDFSPTIYPPRICFKVPLLLFGRKKEIPDNQILSGICSIFFVVFSDPPGVRTQDPILKRDVLYLLS